MPSLCPLPLTISPPLNLGTENGKSPLKKMIKNSGFGELVISFFDYISNYNIHNCFFELITGHLERDRHTDKLINVLDSFLKATYKNIQLSQAI